MKKLLILSALLAVPLLVMAAAPTFDTYSKDCGDKTIDSQWTGNWEPADSLVISVSDSAWVVVTVTGQVWLDPYETFYLGLGNDSANRVDSATSATTGQTHTNLDTCIIKLPRDVQNTAYVPFAFSYRLSAGATGGAVTDTLYLNAATGGSDQKIYLKDVVIQATIGNRD